ncbi:hypothetical protein FHR92_003687 [Fontibacillus solani]|uniref:Uncharacterized protein n=1 Tax=Fontibacillus solani TaxID=1572857 RepID=A0A7W3SW32_9BACL|nr:hypothetical protein [Fontibacillus solani]MBA9087205.1 hypothetical protein [Fontibacillus solani]
MDKSDFTIVGLEPDKRRIVLCTFLTDFLKKFHPVERAIVTMCSTAGSYLNSNAGPIDAVRLFEGIEWTTPEFALSVNLCVLPHTRTNLFNVVILSKNTLKAEHVLELLQNSLDVFCVSEKFQMDDTAKLFEFVRDNSDCYVDSDYIFLFENTLTVQFNAIGFWIGVDNKYLSKYRYEERL